MTQDIRCAAKASTRVHKGRITRQRKICPTCSNAGIYGYRICIVCGRAVGRPIRFQTRQIGCYRRRGRAVVQACKRSVASGFIIAVVVKSVSVSISVARAYIVLYEVLIRWGHYNKAIFDCIPYRLNARSSDACCNCTVGVICNGHALD